jgi:putative transposase
MIDEPPGRKHPIHQLVHERFERPIIVFVTVCTKDRKAILANTAAHDLVLSAWKEADSWQVGRYVVMPDHVHLFCAPQLLIPKPLQTWIGFWKSLVARQWLKQNEAPIWQRHFWDTQLRRGESYDQKWDYVVANPVRAGLVTRTEDWPYQGEMNVLRW